MALNLPDQANPGDSGHIADHNLIKDALVALDARSSGGGMDQTAADDRYVNVTGDMMTGVLTIANSTGVDTSTIAQPLGGNLVITPKLGLTVSKAVTISGDITSTGNISTGQVTANAPVPTAVSHLTRKDYVDTLVASSGGGGGGGGVALLVASSTASAAAKAGAYRVCDGTADQVEIQAALDAVKAEGGGIVQLTEGVYNLSAGLTIVGNDVPATTITIMLVGVGMHTTSLVCATGINGISLSACCSVVIRDLGIAVVGSGSGIVSTRVSTTVMRGFWNSEFTNLYFYRNGSAAHTGWAMNLGSAFRSTFTNIEVFWLHNGVRFYSQDLLFNPGDFTFTRMFVELDDVAGSIGLKIESPTDMGMMNQMVFTMCEFIDSGTGGTAIQFAGTGRTAWGSPGGSWNQFHGINIEQFATLIDIQYGNNNTFDLNYVTTITGVAGGVFFKFGSLTGGNHIRSCGRAEVGEADTVSIITDANTNASSPNILENVNIGVGAGGVANATVTAATRIRGIGGYSDGTLAAVLAFQQTPVRLRHGAAPATPADGDMWTTSAGLYVRVNGVTKTVTLT